MPHFLLLMHTDAARPTPPADWGRYIESLRAGNHFVGGSAVGGGLSVKGDAVSDQVLKQIGGYMVITARDLEEAKQLVQQNPAHLAGCTVEVRDLPRT